MRLNADRDVTLDVLRGMAVFTMVGANLAAETLRQPHPFWLRLYGSFAAPVFLLLAGMMVALTKCWNDYGLRHYLWRGAVIIACGALVDLLVWQILPFTSVDVLYTIGLALPLVYLFLSLRSSHRWPILAGFFLLTPVLRSWLGYTAYPTEIWLDGLSAVEGRALPSIVHHWLIDGWFPIFPWLGFGLLGGILGERRWRERGRQGRTIGLRLVQGLAIAGLGILIWVLIPVESLVREGYSELFYPATLGYVLTAVGLFLLGLIAVDRRPAIAAFKPFRSLGRSALVLYILHLGIIEYGLSPEGMTTGLQQWCLQYLILIAILYALAYGLAVAKGKWIPSALPLRVVLGS